MALNFQHLPLSHFESVNGKLRDLVIAHGLKLLFSPKKNRISGKLLILKIEDITLFEEGKSEIVLPKSSKLRRETLCVFHMKFVCF